MGMSSVALIAVLVHVLSHGRAPAGAEETAAQLFQLLIAGQAPFVAFFALKWLPRMPSEAMHVMAAQAAAALIAIAPVVFFDL
jgi:hypothetical protein